MNDNPEPLAPTPEIPNRPSRSRRSVRWVLLIAGLVLMFTLGATAGVLLDQRPLKSVSAAPQTPAAEGQSQLPSAIEEAWALVHNRYVDSSAIDDQKMESAAISGMLSTLGDEGHTRYLSPDEVAQHDQSLSGSYVGVGIRVEDQGGKVVVVAPLDNSPAQKAGVQAGDTIIAVDGVSVEGMSLQDVVDKVRGPEGSTVTLTFLRPDVTEPLTFTLERQQLRSNPVSWTMLPNKVADIRLGEFSAGASAQLEQAIRAAKQAGATSIVLDLRNNPGGLVDEAIGVASEFLGEGQPVFISKERDGETETHRTRKASKTDLPLVVLVNKGSASAAEIVAGALKDDGRATLVGESTFGTGTVLNQFPLSDGSAILLGTELWLTPKGQLIRNEGISPDITVTLGDQQNPYFPSNPQNPPSQLPDDPQLQRAVAVLTGTDHQDAGTPAAG